MANNPVSGKMATAAVWFDFVKMEDPDFERVSAMVRMSYPKACICWIERVHNAALEAQYTARKASIGNEALMFHGSTEAAVRAIAATGFNPRLNKTSAYGKGTYFAQKASYSFKFMKEDTEGIGFMLLCRVLVGRPCIGSSNLVINTTKYDSAVNNASGSIVVTPYKDAALPEYIICFHKTAQ